MSRLLILLGLAAVAGAKELTPDTWDNEVAGKTVFIKFLAPWCGHCKTMKPAWDKLIAEWKDSSTGLVADVDCTSAGKPLCDSNGVRGFPTIKYGDPSDLQDYQGGRDFDSLSKFAKENLKPVCSPANIDLCDADKKKEIETMQAMSADDLKAKVDEGTKKLEDLETKFKSDVEELQKQYKGLMEQKEKDEQEVKDSGLGLAKAVLAHKKKSSDEL